VEEATRQQRQQWAEIYAAPHKNRGQDARRAQEQAALDQQRRAEVEAEDRREREAKQHPEPETPIGPEQRPTIGSRRTLLQLAPLVIAGLVLLGVLLILWPPQERDRRRQELAEAYARQELAKTKARQELAEATARQELAKTKTRQDPAETDRRPEIISKCVYKNLSLAGRERDAAVALCMRRNGLTE
jgi:hypothetical protein